jgi:hypothetical protein
MHQRQKYKNEFLNARKEVTLFWSINPRKVKTSLRIGQPAWEGTCFFSIALIGNRNRKKNEK